MRLTLFFSIADFFGYEEIRTDQKNPEFVQKAIETPHDLVDSLFKAVVRRILLHLSFLVGPTGNIRGFNKICILTCHYANSDRCFDKTRRAEVASCLESNGAKHSPPAFLLGVPSGKIQAFSISGDF